MIRSVYYISDGTGITAESLGHSLITQFEQIDFHTHTLPYIDSNEKARLAVEKINESFNYDKVRPIIFSTIVKPEIRNIIKQSQGFVIDFFQAFIGSLESELQVPASSAVGLSHALVDEEQYSTRIEAVNYALQCDDGLNTHHYHSADIILIGISRTGKTPTCLYLALQFGIRAANYPLTEEDLNSPCLPAALSDHRHLLFGLSIEAERLHYVRNKRQPDSRYASLAQCELESSLAERVFLLEKIRHLNSTHLSVEELSAHILSEAGLRH